MNYLVTPRMCPGKEPIFDPMYELCVESYRRHLRGRWEPKILTGTYRDYHAMAEDEFRQIHALWQAGHNCFFVDADTVAASPLEVFGRYPQMMMFWKTCDVYKAGRPYLNAGVMYFPASMDAKLWEIGLARAAKGFDPSTWGQDQQAWNDMFYAQDPVPALDPAMNWSPHVRSPISAAEAKILHFHATKDANRALDLVRQVLTGEKPRTFHVLSPAVYPEKRRVIHDDGTGNPRYLEDGETV